MFHRILPVAFVAAIAGILAGALVSCKTTRSLGAGPFSTVIVDAGHGGHNRGARAYRGQYEKDLTLDTANRLANILRKRGFRVIMTRSSDQFVSLDRRVNISNASRDSIFVSVHYNWVRYPSGRGTETFYYSERSRRLAANVQAELARSYNTPNRGVKRRGFYVLRKNSRPAILVECGFISNPSDNAFIQTASGRQKIAEAIAQGIVNERQGRQR